MTTIPNQSNAIDTQQETSPSLGSATKTHSEHICLSDKCPDGCALYHYPVYTTHAIWTLIEEAIADEEMGNDLVGVVHDLMWMSQANATTLRPRYSAFECIVNGANRPPDQVLEGGNHLYRFILECGPLDSDDPTPVLTLLFPDEQ